MFEYSKPTARSRAPRVRHLAVLAALGLALTGCNSAHRPLAQFEAAATDDYRLRHPIKVAPAPLTLALDVHKGAKGLTPAQTSSVQAFARGYRSNGSGPMVLSVPAGAGNAVALDHAAQSVQVALSKAGVGYIDIQHVHAGAHGASTLALTYHAVGARVDSCGQWPADAALTGNSANRSYHNFGCATQRNMAAMVANPHDLQRPRAIGPSSATRRVDVLTKYGKAEATATAYDTSNQVNASSVGN